MNNQAYIPGVRCAYELCKRSDPIESIPGHRRKLYHDDNCRQAQHRLLAARKVREALSQLWSAFLPETQQFLSSLLEQSGEALAQRAIAAITTERNQAQAPSLTEDEQAAIRQQWGDVQPFTRNILESLLTQRHDTLSLFNLIMLAISEERRHAACNSELERRAAYLEVTLAEYRQIVDLEGREKIEQQFKVTGELLGYRAMPHYHLGEGVERWEDYRSWTDERTLAEVVRDGKEILAEEGAARMRAQEKSRLRQVERQLAEAQKRVKELELEREAGHGSLLADPQQIEVQLANDLNAVRINVANPELYQTLYGQALLVVKEREREVQHLKTRISKQLERRLAKQQARIEELEKSLQAQEKAPREEMMARLLALGERLQFCRLMVANIPASADAWQQWMSQVSDEQLRQALAAAAHYYENLVYLDELEQRARQDAQAKQQKGRPH
jgi:hypothetical protein